MDFILDPSLVLYLPLWKLDGASIMSDDAYGHTCTVTGASWRLNGRLFDGTDDLITITEAASITNLWDGGGTAIIWLNASSDGEGDSGHILRKLGGSGGWLLTVGYEVSGFLRVIIDYQHATAGATWRTINRVLPLSTWTMVTYSYNPDNNANNPIIYLNTTAYTIGNGLTETVAPDGTRKDDSGADLLLGNNSTLIRTWDGYFGEIMIYSRVLTPLEIQHNYLATKWRYR